MYLFLQNKGGHTFTEDCNMEYGLSNVWKVVKLLKSSQAVENSNFSKRKFYDKLNLNKISI